MEVEIVSPEKRIVTRKEAEGYARAFARICYTKRDFEKVLQEESPEKLTNDLLRRGHHSPFDQPRFNFYFIDIPKILAMFLNNEKDYSTAEKSARYTQMQIEGRQRELYNKWLGIFEKMISQRYPDLDIRQKEKTKKLAQENARYLTSVFTPTRMGYCVSFRQLNYLMNFFNTFIKTEADTPFNRRVKEAMKDFNAQLDFLYNSRIDPTIKLRRLSLIAQRRTFAEEFGENYSTTYDLSFAGLAQAQRHRTLDYEIQSPDQQQNPTFFVPPIIAEDSALVAEWLSDLNSISGEIPQATLVKTHESGSHTNFISKAGERLCGNAQWEVMDNTRRTLERYLIFTRHTNADVHNALEPYSHGPRCTFPGIKCIDPCPFRGVHGLERVV